MYRGGSKIGHFVSDATKKKISLAQKGKINIGRRNSPETEIKKGQRLSPKTEFKNGHKFHLGKHIPKPKLKEYYRSKRIKANCSHCGKELSIIKSRNSRGLNHFCSWKCQRKFHSGSNNNKWKGGITPENQKIRKSIEFRLWREAIFARDNWICQQCKKQGGVLHAHHTKKFSEYPELRFALDNGVTLCKQCHEKL